MKRGKSSQEAFRRPSVVETQSNEIERSPESATSTMEILHPRQETNTKSKDKHRVSRWDSLRNSWSRHSSRRKFSTFKPPQPEKLTVPDSTSQPSWMMPPGQVSTFGGHGQHTPLPDNISEPEVYKTPVPANDSARLSSNVSCGHLATQSPEYKTPIPPTYYSNNRSPIPMSDYYNHPLPDSGYKNPHYHPHNTDAGSYPVPSYSQSGNVVRPFMAENPHHQNHVPNPVHRNSHYQVPTSRKTLSNYTRTDPNPSYRKSSLPNPSYDGRYGDRQQRMAPHGGIANGFSNPVFNMSDTPHSGQAGPSNSTHASRQPQFAIENSLHFNQRPPM
jgi:hypothetical protein